MYAIRSYYANRLRNEFGLDATSPYSGSVYDLVANKYLIEAKAVPLAEHVREKIPQEEGAETRPPKLHPEKKLHGEPQPHWESKQGSAYQQLLVALERLVDIIRSSKGRSNRELRSVTNQLNAISDEMERE